MAKPRYPLEQLLDVKKDRVEKAEKEVNDKKKILEIEQEKLVKVEKERDAVLKHHKEKLSQLREALDTGTTSPEILQMKSYIKIVKENLAKEEAKVLKQKDLVKAAEKNLEIAIEDLKRKRVELEKIILHKKEWDKETKKEMEKEETQISDELGTVIHQAKKRKRSE